MVNKLPADHEVMREFIFNGVDCIPLAVLPHPPFPPPNNNNNNKSYNSSSSSINNIPSPFLSLSCFFLLSYYPHPPFVLPPFLFNFIFLLSQIFSPILILSSALFLYFFKVSFLISFLFSSLVHSFISFPLFPSSSLSFY